MKSNHPAIHRSPRCSGQNAPEPAAEEVPPHIKAARLLDLYFSVARNDYEKVVHCLAKGTDVNSHRTDSEGWTPLHIAASMGRTAIVQLLLQHGARTDVLGVDAPGQYPKEWTPLLAANGHPAIVALLMQAGADINYQEATGKRRSVLHLASGKDNAEAVIALLRLGADRTLRDAAGFTAYEHAVHCDAHAVVQAWDTFVVAEQAQAAIEDPTICSRLRPL